MQQKEDPIYLVLIMNVLCFPELEKNTLTPTTSFSLFKKKSKKYIIIIVKHWLRSRQSFGGELMNFIKLFSITLCKFVMLTYFDCFCHIFLAMQWIKYFKEVKVLRGHSGIVYCARFSSDCRTIVASSFDNVIQLFDVESEQEIKQSKGHSDDAITAQFSPDGCMIVLCSDDEMI
ncbi:WD repeat-containing protein [Reticulomyxa filosa]|uniref:WD repeat-containing protein n=1 Tax=Reticulomyxa filosa TaxID=46433 RepID=X6LW93_RETFI|nr:WD repeat-containing protein [Reticulomyxa filosa]|eukprot:ETO05402.1 WD repeat-containing protein [Reticulomyxa filosa]